MNDEVTEALRSAQELCAYLWNNTDANNPEAGNVELVAHSDEDAAQLAALLNDARARIDAALHGLEIQQADVGKTNQCTHPNCNCWMGVCSKGPHGPTSERLMRKFYGPPK